MTTSRSLKMRHTRATPCPICGGHEGLPRGRGERCAGFTSDGWAHCSREERAGGLPPTNATPPTYAHLLNGHCRCGRTHGAETAFATIAPRIVAKRTADTNGAIKATRAGTDRNPISEKRDEIREPDGTLAAIHLRRDYGPKDKEFIWLSPDGTSGLKGRKAETLPLYGSHLLAKAPPGAPVVFNEGEKATDSLNGVGILAVGSVTGAGVTPSADVLRVLDGRVVYLWPDHDDKGRDHMARIAARLLEIGVTAKRIYWKDAAEEGDDAADFFVRGGSADTVRLWMQAAPPWTVASAETMAGPLTGEPLLVCASSVTVKPVRWLWTGRIPCGKLTLIFGDPGQGKSFLTLDLAARVSTGADWPTGGGK